MKCENTDVMKKLSEHLSDDVVFCSTGKKLRPNPYEYVVNEKITKMIGGLDPDYTNDYVRIADFVARIIEAGYKTKNIEDWSIPYVKDGVDGNVYIKKRKYALLRMDRISEMLVDAVSQINGSVLVVAEEVPCAIEKLVDAEEIILITPDVAGAKAAQILLGVQWVSKSVLEYNDNEKLFDRIILFESISRNTQYREALVKLHKLLKSNGKLIMHEENIMGFHRLGQFLASAHRGVMPRFHEGELIKLNMEGVSKSIYGTFEKSKYNDLYKQLYSIYKLEELKNILSLITTIFVVEAPK